MERPECNEIGRAIDIGCNIDLAALEEQTGREPTEGKMMQGVVHTQVQRAARSLVLVLTVAALALPSGAIAAEVAIPAQPPAPTAADTPAPAPVATSTATLVDPPTGKHLDYLEVAPMVQFDPVDGERPKWVLLASDAAMTKTVRYCRQFVWAALNGSYHWGCNKWATGTDAAGNDQLLPLEPGTVYYWQVVTENAAADGELTSTVRSFAVDAKPREQTIEEISQQVVGTAFDDGTQLNLGAAAFVNSNVKVKKIFSSKLGTSTFRMRVTHVGAVDVSRSYIKVSSAAGTRYLKLANAGNLTVGGVWRLTAAERRLKTKRFTYQAFLKSRANGAMVRSQFRVVVIRTPAKSPVVVPD